MSQTREAGASAEVTSSADRAVPSDDATRRVRGPRRRAARGLAITDEHRAEEEEAKAEEAVAAAEEEESKKARKRREAEERGRPPPPRPSGAREPAPAAEQARRATRPSVGVRRGRSSPGVGSDSDPKAAAAAAAGSRAAPERRPRRRARRRRPEKPELLVGAAFVGAFLFARILKRIAE